MGVGVFGISGHRRPCVVLFLGRCAYGVICVCAGAGIVKGDDRVVVVGVGAKGW
jgi:hypothetical protein